MSSMQLRDASQIRRPGRYTEDYDFGDPGRPIFIHPDVPFNKELAKYVAFDTLPLDHPGPNPSRVRYEAAQKGNPTTDAPFHSSQNTSSQESQASQGSQQSQSSQASKVVRLARKAPRGRIVPIMENQEDAHWNLDNRSLEWRKFPDHMKQLPQLSVLSPAYIVESRL